MLLSTKRRLKEIFLKTFPIAVVWLQEMDHSLPSGNNLLANEERETAMSASEVASELEFAYPKVNTFRDIGAN